MRILTVGNMYPPHHLGGYELLWRGAVRHLRNAGHHVRVLTTDYQAPPTPVPREQEDPDVHRELRWYWRNHAFRRPSWRDALALERHNAATLERHLAEHQPDVISWWAMGAMSLSLIERAHRRSLPAVGFVIDDWMVYGPRADAWLRRWRGIAPVRAAVERLSGIPSRFNPGPCAHWVFASEATRRQARARWDLPSTAIAHCGIDRSFLAQSRAPERWCWRVLCVGRIDPRKGIDTAIEALGRLPEATTLRIVGDGDPAHRRELGALSSQLGLNARVLFAGSAPHSELPGIYSDADVVAFPVRWDEPWGLVPLEAMARRRPVVATGSGGSGEYLRDGENCLIVPRDDPDALAAAVTRIAQDAALRARLTAGGVTTAARFTDDSFHAEVEDAHRRRCDNG